MCATSHNYDVALYTLAERLTTYYYTHHVPPIFLLLPPSIHYFLHTSYRCAIPQLYDAQQVRVCKPCYALVRQGTQGPHAQAQAQAEWGAYVRGVAETGGNAEGTSPSGLSGPSSRSPSSHLGQHLRSSDSISEIASAAASAEVASRRGARCTYIVSSKVRAG